MAVNEQIVTGRKFRKLIDEATKLWQRISFWTKASDVEFDDGQTAEKKMGAISGITSDLNGESENVAASIKALNQLNNKLASRPEWITDSSGRITGYKTPGGADTVFPFRNVADGTFTGVTNTPVTVTTGFRPDRICIAASSYTNRSTGIYYYPHIGITSNAITYHGTIQITDSGFVYTATNAAEAGLHYYTACKL